MNHHIAYYYIKYSLDGRLVVKSTLCLNNRLGIFNALDCDIFIRLAIEDFIKSKIKINSIKSSSSRLTKINLIPWRYTSNPSDIKKPHGKLKRDLAFIIVNKKAQPSKVGKIK